MSQFHDLRHLTGPFDVVGDVHGCFDELVELLELLGWTVASDDEGPSLVAPAGRTLVFVGDLVDRGPGVVDVLRLAMRGTTDGHVLCVLGNHDDKLRRALEGRDVTVAHGLGESLEQLDAEPEAFRESVREYLHALPTHLILDEGRLVIAHAGLPAELHGTEGRRTRSFALYGDTTGERDDYGLPVRKPWARDYDGPALVLYGHTPVATPEVDPHAVCLDTGCVFGGSLTAYRYPEGELVSVPARREYTPSLRPL